jgi:hypothetical protein
VYRTEFQKRFDDRFRRVTRAHRIIGFIIFSVFAIIAITAIYRWRAAKSCEDSRGEVDCTCIRKEALKDSTNEALINAYNMCAGQYVQPPQ